MINIHREANQALVYLALIKGLEVKVGGIIYGMSEDGDLIHEAVLEHEGEVSKVWLGFMGGANLTYFHSICEKMTEDERCTLVAELMEV